MLLSFLSSGACNVELDFPTRFNFDTQNRIGRHAHTTHTYTQRLAPMQKCYLVSISNRRNTYFLDSYLSAEAIKLVHSIFSEHNQSFCRCDAVSRGIEIWKNRLSI